MTDFYCIYLRQIGMNVSIGIHDFERAGAQPMQFSVVLILRPPSTSDDAIEQVVDYDLVRKTIDELTKTRHWELQESLCSAIGDDLLRHDGVLGVVVRSAKTSVYQDTESVGCHLARLSPELGAGFPWWTLHV